MITLPIFQKLFKLLQLREGSNLGDLIKTKQFANSVYQSKDNTKSDIFVFPLIRQSDPRIVRLKLSLFYEVVKKFPINDTFHPLTVGEIDHNIYKLLSTTTHVVESGVPGVTEEIRKSHFEEAGLQMGYDTQYHSNYSNYVKFLYSETKPTNVRIPLDSNRGLGTDGRDKLKSILDPIYTFKAILQMGKDVGLEDYKIMMKFLWEKAAINLFATNIQRRQARSGSIFEGEKEIDPHEAFQTMSKSRFISNILTRKWIIKAKPRKILDPIVGRREARERPDDQRILVDGKNREAANLSSKINKFGSLLIKPVYSSFMDRYPETFKFRDIKVENDNLRRLNLRHSVANDIEKYDNNFITEDFNAIEDGIAASTSRQVGRISNLARGFGLVYPYKGKVYITKPEGPISALASGTPRTPSDGKTKNSFAQMNAHLDSQDHNEIIYDSVLSWTSSSKGNFKNNSDDAFDSFTTSEQLEKFMDKYIDKNKYFKVSTEKSCIYSGKTLNRAVDDSFYWTDTPSSVLVNILVREYSYGYYDEYDGSLIGQKPYSTLGYMMKRENPNTFISNLVQMLEKEFFDIFRFDLWTYLKKYLKLPFDGNLTDLEKAYLVDPSIVSWKLSASDTDSIRKELIDDNYITFSAEVIDYIYQELGKL